MTNEEKFTQVTDTLKDIYLKKNHDYGDSFTDVVNELGDRVALGQIAFKFFRLKQLVKGVEAKVRESLVDSIRDMANYCIMWLMILEERENGNEES